MGVLQDLTGKTFGRLTVIRRAENYILPSGQRQTMWLCKCSCGNNKDIIVRGADLKNGHTISCGCLKQEVSGSRYFEDLTGRRFGKLTVIKRGEDYINENGDKLVRWKCKCDCGNEDILVIASSLKKGHTKSCGCLRKENNNPRFDDLTGKRFGRLTVIERAESRKQPKGGRSTRWLCQCDCGNVVLVNASTLKNGESKSCGCIKSYAEIKIIQWLKDHNIEYIPQKRFNGLVGIGGGKLSYDFYIPQYNILIEAQGIQHERPIDYFGGKKQFAVQQEHDELKRKYAKNNNFDLLEIWYYDYDRIEEILNKELEVG